jgi:hypothetical protein
VARILCRRRVLRMFAVHSMIANKFLLVAINGNTTDLNLFTLAGSPTGVKNWRFVIAGGVTIGQSAALAALTVGQFPTGSIIDITNNGFVEGKGGTPGGTGGTSGDPDGTVGTNGGDCIKADYANQTVTITNNGTIRAGGGAGGGGGRGGQGGQGGNGACKTFWAGGAGGAGGNGGRGQGYDGAAVAGSAGTAGSAAIIAPGTTGSGGTGGTGGDGATWGATGETGDTGANGGDSLRCGVTRVGDAGTAGSAGGTAGRYLVKGAHNVTLTNNGTVQGGLA